MRLNLFILGLEPRVPRSLWTVRHLKRYVETGFLKRRETVLLVLPSAGLLNSLISCGAVVAYSRSELALFRLT